MSLQSKFGIAPRIKLKEISENHIGIMKMIKSRIIQKDTLKLIEIANSIRDNSPETRVSLICTRNICSKSKALLEQNDIDIFFQSLEE